MLKKKAIFAKGKSNFCKIKGQFLDKGKGNFCLIKRQFLLKMLLNLVLVLQKKKKKEIAIFAEVRGNFR